VRAQLPRFGQAGEGLESRIVRFHAQARETAARRLGAGGEIDIAAAHDSDRHAYTEAPPRVDYELTELGRTLIDPIRMLAQWAEANGDAILDAQDRS
jgi:hypothetical protein